MMGEAGKRQNVLQAGVIGTGFIGIVQIDSIRRIPGIRLAAVCEALPERLWEVKERYGICLLYTSVPCVRWQFLSLSARR